MVMATEILSNGSKWAGEQPDSIDDLLAVLAAEPLDRIHEAYGNFIEVAAEGDTWAEPGTVGFHGNFLNLSHVFDIRTTDAGVIERLTAAIRTNQQRADYLAQPDHAQRKAAEEAARQARDEKKRKERLVELAREMKALERAS
jgi:hypothetical protein